jgi:hypothetical protein
LKTKCKGIIQDKDHEFTERVIKLKGLKTSAAEIIPLKDISSIIYFLASKYEIFKLPQSPIKPFILVNL